jgi:hypothetical protein
MSLNRPHRLLTLVCATLCMATRWSPYIVGGDRPRAPVRTSSLSFDCRAREATHDSPLAATSRATDDRIASSTSCALCPRAEADLKSSAGKRQSHRHRPFPLLRAPPHCRPPLATDRHPLRLPELHFGFVMLLNL